MFNRELSPGEKVGMRRHHTLRSERPGSVLVIVLVMAGILAITGTGLLSLGLNTYRRALYTAQEIAARSAAEAGVAKALFAMKSWDGVHFPSATNESVPGCDGRFSYTLAAGTPDGYEVDVTGQAGNATKVIHARLASRNSLFGGLTLSQSAIINTGAQVLPAVGSSNPKLLINSTAAGAVDLEASSITFQGDVVVGPGGNPATVIDGEEAVSGTISAASTTTTFPAVTAPTGLPSRGNITGSTTITQDGQYGKIDLTGNGKEVTIQGHRTLYVTGDVRLRNNAHIIVAPNSSLTLYVGGSITLQHKAHIEEATYDPGKVLILGTASCTDITIENEFLFYGALYAPAASMALQDEAEVHGAFACKTLNAMKTNAKLYYDDRVGTIQMSASPTTYCISYWQDN